jgi:GT2 family glycosyltransferase
MLVGLDSFVGLKLAYEKDFDRIWLMDDVVPDSNALKEMLSFANRRILGV